MSRLFPILVMLFSIASYAAEPLIYIVRTGDTLSTIAQKQIGSPVFPKRDGSLSKLFKMNPIIAVDQLIFAGQRLVIRTSEMQSLAVVESAPKAQSETPLRQLAAAETPKASEVPIDKASPVSSKQIEIPHHLLLDVTMGMTTLASTDAASNTSATLFSSHDLSVGLGWQQDWSDSFSTKFSAKFRSIDFQQPTSSTKSISDSKKFTTGLGLGAESKLSSKFSLSYGASYNQELFLRRRTSSAVSLDSVAVPKFSVGAAYQIFAVGKASIGVNGSFDYLMGATTDGYTVSNGMAYQGGFYLKRGYGIDKSVKLNINYRDRAQNTSIVNSHEKTVFGTLVFSLPLFGESENK